jgi:hypothetical protein
LPFTINWATSPSRKPPTDSADEPDLIIISGLFIIGAPLTGEDDNQGVSLAQQIKMAGLFSFFGYLSGYDPTVFSSVIGFGAKHLNSTRTKD